VLRRLSTTSTPFAPLLALACDELEHVLGAVRSDKLDELERDSSLESARLEVEIQRQHERIVKLRHEAVTLREDLHRRDRDLDLLNSDIARLQRLHEQYGISIVKEKPKAQEDWSQYRELSQPVAKLDDELYRTLWTEQQQIHNEIQGLESEWEARQNDQLGEMRKYILRRYPQLAILR
jgi:chromosome segregation ATPase